GQFELSAQQASDQLRAQIEDLQVKVTKLEAALASAPPRGPEETLPEILNRPFAPQEAAPPGSAVAPPRRILWVDDKPENNATLIAILVNEAIEVDTARTTRQALDRLAAAPDGYAAVVTDQGRLEESGLRRNAGTELVRRMRAEGIGLPVALYTSARGATRGGAAREAGADLVTASPSDLRAFVAAHVGEGDG
ncbi:MAG: hypothetical protein ACK5MQ_15100, partial [Pikeienuella sp.]